MLKSADRNLIRKQDMLTVQSSKNPTCFRRAVTPSIPTILPQIMPRAGVSETQEYYHLEDRSSSMRVIGNCSCSNFTVGQHCQAGCHQRCCHIVCRCHAWIQDAGDKTFFQALQDAGNLSLPAHLSGSLLLCHLKSAFKANSGKQFLIKAETHYNSIKPTFKLHRSWLVIEFDMNLICRARRAFITDAS